MSARATILVSSAALVQAIQDVETMEVLQGHGRPSEIVVAIHHYPTVGQIILRVPGSLTQRSLIGEVISDGD